MKKIVSFFLVGIFVFLSTNAGAGSCLAMSDESDLIYQLNFDGESYSVVDCDESAKGEVTIPEMYNDLPVIRIGRQAFKNCKKITSVIIGNRITTIGDSAFENCSSLEAVAFPEAVAYSKSTRIVNDCQEIKDWNKYNPTGCAADYDNFISGSQSIHFSSGQISCTKDIYDMLNNNLVLNLRINSISNGARLYMQVCNTNDKSAYATYEIMRGSSITPTGSWREITVPYTGYSNISVDKLDFAKIDQIKFYVSGGEVDWNLQYIGEKPIVADKGIVSFTFDDGYKSQYNGLEILGQKGIKGTLFYIPEADTNGSDDYLKINDLKKLVELYQTDVEVHGVSSYNDKTNEELIEHWESTQKLFKENGLGEGKHMAYPNGMHDDRVVNLAKNYFDSCRTIQYYIPAETYLPADQYRIRAISSIGASGNNVEYIKDKIDKAALSKSWLVLVFHRIEDGDSTMYCSENDIAAIADYAIKSDVEIKTMAEVMDGTSSITAANGSIRVGDYAFYSCNKLKELTIPESVQHIGERAFGYSEGQNGICEKTEGLLINVNKNSVAHSYSEDNALVFDIICNDHIASDWIIDKASTCTENGSKHKECTFCGDILETQKIELKEHKESNWETVTEATVNNAGNKIKKCTECSKIIKTAEISQLKCNKPALKNVYNANSYMKVTWETVEGADLYRVYRMVSGGDYEYIGSTKKEYFNDKDAPAGKTCRYRILGKNEAGNSKYSNSLAIKHIDEPALKTIETASSGVKITWDKVTGAKKYSVYRKVSGGEYKNIGETSKTSYTDKTAESGVKYYYAIRAKRDDSISSQSASISQYYLADPTLNAPTSTKSGVKLTWSKVIGASGYVVYRKTGSGSYTELATVKGNAKVTYTDKSANKGTKYYYKVKAYKGSTYSAYSNTKKIKDKY